MGSYGIPWDPMGIAPWRPTLLGTFSASKTNVAVASDLEAGTSLQWWDELQDTAQRIWIQLGEPPWTCGAEGKTSIQFRLPSALLQLQLHALQAKLNHFWCRGYAKSLDSDTTERNGTMIRFLLPLDLTSAMRENITHYSTTRYINTIVK